MRMLVVYKGEFGGLGVPMDGDVGCGILSFVSTRAWRSRSGIWFLYSSSLTVERQAYRSSHSSSASSRTILQLMLHVHIHSPGRRGKQVYQSGGLIG